MGNKTSIPKVIQTSPFCDLPGEILCSIGRFVTHENLSLFFLIHREVIPSVTRHGFFELKCKDLRITYDEESKTAKEAFVDSIKWEIVGRYHFMVHVIERRLYGDNLEFREIVEGVYPLYPDSVTVQVEDRKMKVVKNDEGHTLPITLHSPDYQYCPDMGCRNAAMQRMDLDLSVQFRVFSENIDSISVGFLATHMASYRQKSEEYQMVGAKDIEIESGDLVTLTRDKAKDVFFYNHRLKKKFAYLLKNACSNLSPSNKDLMIFRVLVKLKHPGDSLEIVNVRRESIPNEKIMEQLPQYIKDEISKYSRAGEKKKKKVKRRKK